MNLPQCVTCAGSNGRCTTIELKDCPCTERPGVQEPRPVRPGPLNATPNDPEPEGDAPKNEPSPGDRKSANKPPGDSTPPKKILLEIATHQTGHQQQFHQVQNARKRVNGVQTAMAVKGNVLRGQVLDKKKEENDKKDKEEKDRKDKEDKEEKDREDEEEKDRKEKEEKDKIDREEKDKKDKEDKDKKEKEEKDRKDQEEKNRKDPTKPSSPGKKCPAPLSPEQPKCDNPLCGGDEGICLIGIYTGCPCREGCPKRGDEPRCTDALCLGGEDKKCPVKNRGCPCIECPAFPGFPWCNECGGADNGICKGISEKNFELKQCSCFSRPPQPQTPIEPMLNEINFSDCISEEPTEGECPIRLPSSGTPSSSIRLRPASSSTMSRTSSSARPPAPISTIGAKRN
ncbi:hypothetical protein IQ06DRAFT_306275 [Phaeosphaeriaceae sp. SRC1lsM3a]|nr:hypothetical protein IQ06DRAFT_306275 [Stagonospora sp. SRC1lsM3a]